MLSSEFNSEMGALIRSLESQVRQHPGLIHADVTDVIDDLDKLLVTLVAARIALKEIASREH